MTRPSIRAARPDDLASVQSCARAAYHKYLERMDREPAPMRAVFEGQIANGLVHVAVLEGDLVGYVVFYPQGDHVHLENVAVLPAHAGHGLSLIHI